MNKILVTALILVTAVLTQSSCAQQSDSGSSKDGIAEINALTRLGCDNDQQCKSLGVGASPCGGYLKYLVYSNKNTDVIQLKDKVIAYNEAQKQQNKKSGKMGICQHISPPKSYCLMNRCVPGSNSIIQ